MLQNAYFLAKIGADTAENEQHFAEILPKTGNYPTGPGGAEPLRGARRRRCPAAGVCDTCHQFQFGLRGRAMSTSAVPVSMDSMDSGRMGQRASYVVVDCGFDRR